MNNGILFTSLLLFLSSSLYAENYYCTNKKGVIGAIITNGTFENYISKSTIQLFSPTVSKYQKRPISMFKYLHSDGVISMYGNGNYIDDGVNFIMKSSMMLKMATSGSYGYHNLELYTEGYTTNKVLKCFNSESFMKDKKIFKILTKVQWNELEDNGIFKGSEHDQRDGFIHLAGQRQIARILKKYYSDQETVYIVEFSASDYSKNLKWEVASNGEAFPHIYKDALLYDNIKNIKIIEMP